MTDLLIEQAVGLVAYLVVILIGVFGAWLTSKIAKKTELANIKAATENLIQMTQQTVNELQQTTVEKMKAAHKDGKLTQDEIKTLGYVLLEITEAKLTDSVKGLLVAANVDLEALIKSTAEAYIHQEFKAGW
ncbi:hypothetical protein SDC9_64509 [bioreactor metagenome]|uniref:Uncharacterized protein n=1 Tax=bioreactor metagenome TaxID=1076179 RepID=A0A644XUX7_9ZZZZ